MTRLWRRSETASREGLSFFFADSTSSSKEALLSSSCACMSVGWQGGEACAGFVIGTCALPSKNGHREAKGGEGAIEKVRMVRELYQKLNQLTSDVLMRIIEEEPLVILHTRVRLTILRDKTDWLAPSYSKHSINESINCAL